MANISEDDGKKLKTYYDRFQGYVQPKLNPVFTRYKFNNVVQKSDTTEQFVTSLILHVKDCNYTDPDEMVRDRVVFGTSSSKVREKLINEGEKLTLGKAIQISQSYEYSREQLKLMEDPDVQHTCMHAASKTAHRPRYSGNRRPQQTGSNYRVHKKKTVFTEIRNRTLRKLWLSTQARR